MAKLKTVTEQNVLNSLLNGNKQWQKKHSSSFFSQHEQGQKPKALFISCSDSRVAPSEISQSSIGKLFEFRNIANLALPKDQNLQAVVRFAVSHLNIQHIIVCGHYGCGGIKAAMEIADNNAQIETELSDWLKPIVTLYQDNKPALSNIKDSKQRYEAFVELNVMAQVGNLESIPFIQQLKQTNERKMPTIQGAVYDLATGELKLLNKPPLPICASTLKNNIELNVKRLHTLSKSNNPFLRIGAQEKCIAIQSAMKVLDKHSLVAAYGQTDSELYQALNKKRTLPFSFFGINQKSWLSHESETLQSLRFANKST